MTRLTWDNAAVMSPKTAAALGVCPTISSALRSGGDKVELSVFILPGQPEGVIGLALGYGHTHLGQIANGVGQNVYLLRTSSAMYATAAQIAGTGGKSELATVQNHHIIDTVGKAGYKQRVDEDMMKELTYAEYVGHPPRERRRRFWPCRCLTSTNSTAAWTKSAGLCSAHDLHKWGMAIDLTVCTGCWPVWWRVRRKIMCRSWARTGAAGAARCTGCGWTGTSRPPVICSPMRWTPARWRVHQPVLCMQCENAPCEEVCPVGATTHSHEGLNMMTYNRCIGTRYCSNNCPYKVRRFNFFDFNAATSTNLYTPNLLRPELEISKMQKNPQVTVRMRGVMEKCTYCVQRIENARIDRRSARATRPVPGRRYGDRVPAGCPTDAIVFGDLNQDGKNGQPYSRVSKLHEQDRRYGLLDDTLNTKPRTKYLKRSVM